MDPPLRKMLFRLTLLLLAASASGVVPNTEPPQNSNGPSKTPERGHSSTEHSDIPPPCNSSEPHHEFVLLPNGSLVLPGSDQVHEFDTYYLANDTAFLCMADEDSGAHNFSEEFLNCGGHILIDASEFELLDNGDVRVDIYNRTYGSADYYMDPGRGVFVCVPDFADMLAKRNETHAALLDKFPPEFAYVTFAGLSVSVVCLLSHLTVFCLVSTARNLPGCCLASLSVSLLMAYACFLAVASVDIKSDGCAPLGMCVYYFFLTSFFWMNAIAFDVWRSFRSVMRELRISSHRVPWRRFLSYSLYCWAVPGLLVVAVTVLDSVDAVPGDLRPMFGEVNCWFGSRLALLFFFAVPLCLVMVLNAAFFLDVTCVISRATLKTSQEATLRKRFFMFMRLGLIMGLTWIVGLVAALVEHVSIWYAFVVLNTLQGLFIFVVFSCSSKVKGLLCCCSARYRNRDKKRGSTSVRISQISGQV